MWSKETITSSCLGRPGSVFGLWTILILSDMQSGSVPLTRSRGRSVVSRGGTDRDRRVHGKCKQGTGESVRRVAQPHRRVCT